MNALTNSASLFRIGGDAQSKPGSAGTESSVGQNGWGGFRPPRKRENFTDYLPWMEYLPEAKAFLMEDGHSVGAIWEIDPVGTEGRTEEFKSLLWERAFNILTDAIPEIEPDPWVLQIFASNDFDLSKLVDRSRAHVSPEVQGSLYEAEHHKMLDRHYERMSRPGGVFKDKMSDTDWRGKVRRIRFVLYRRLAKDPGGTVALEELGDVAAKLELAFANAGVTHRRYEGKDLYDWMVGWFNPKPAMCDGDVRDLAKVAPYPGDEEMPFGRDFGELLCFTEPVCRASEGIIELDGIPHTVLTTQGLRKKPKVGQFTGELSQGDRTFALMDKFPDEAILSMAITFLPQDVVQEHVAKIKRSSVGDQVEAQLAAEEAAAVAEKMARGDNLYPVETVVYLSGENDHALRRSVHEVSGQLASNGIQPIAWKDELLGLDRWMGNLPMAFRPQKAKKTHRSRFQHASHIAAALPIYGRSRGTGNPGILMFNRGGEPFTVDPLCIADRKKNAHSLFIGPTGAGKSAKIISALMQLNAIYRPRIYVVEVGGSFNLMAEHFRRHDLTVNRVTLRPGENISLPPFADAFKVLDAIDQSQRSVDAEVEAEIDDDDDERRDILGEMEIAAKLMITGGEASEIEKFSRSDRLAVRHAIIQAARNARADNAAITKPIDVARALRTQLEDASLTDTRKDRVRALADGLELFADNTSIAGQLFNQEGQTWPEADVTVVDLATLARDGYEAELAVAYVGLMNHVNNVAERHQHDWRQTIVVSDEAHIILRMPLLASYIVKITKMWRKLGTWYWAGSQNLADFAAEARKILSMFGFIFALVMPKEEVEQLERLLELSDEQKKLLLSAQKEPGKFIEGVLLSDVQNALFRDVAWALALALSMTEKPEKAERARIMEERGFSEEIDAAYVVAERLEQGR